MDLIQKNQLVELRDMVVEIINEDADATGITATARNMGVGIRIGEVPENTFIGVLAFEAGGKVRGRLDGVARCYKWAGCTAPEVARKVVKSAVGIHSAREADRAFDREQKAAQEKISRKSADLSRTLSAALGRSARAQVDFIDGPVKVEMTQQELSDYIDMLRGARNERYAAMKENAQ